MRISHAIAPAENKTKMAGDCRHSCRTRFGNRPGFSSLRFGPPSFFDSKNRSKPTASHVLINAAQYARRRPSPATAAVDATMIAFFSPVEPEGLFQNSLPKEPVRSLRRVSRSSPFSTETPPAREPDGHVRPACLCPLSRPGRLNLSISRAFSCTPIRVYIVLDSHVAIIPIRPSDEKNKRCRSVGDESTVNVHQASALCHLYAIRREQNSWHLWNVPHAMQIPREAPPAHLESRWEELIRVYRLDAPTLYYNLVWRTAPR